MFWEPKYSKEEILNMSFYTLAYDMLVSFYPQKNKFYLEQCAFSYAYKVFNSKMKPASFEELIKYSKEYFLTHNSD